MVETVDPNNGVRSMRLSTGLALPSLDGVAPGYIVNEGPRYNPAEAAEAARILLDAGVLREADWCGDLERSIQAGLTRWANVEMGCGKLQFFDDLVLTFSMDVKRGVGDDVDASYWSERKDGVEGASIGIIAISSEGWQLKPVECRRRVNELECDFPGSALGRSILMLLQSAFDIAVEGHSFRWARNFLESFDSDYGCDEEAEESGFLTVNKFLRSVPSTLTEFIKADIVRRNIDDALRYMAGSKRLQRYEGMLESAVGLDDLMRRISDRFKGSMCDLDALVSLGSGYEVIRNGLCYTVWTGRDDPMHHTIDEHYNPAINEGVPCEMSWGHCFQLAHPGVYERSVNLANGTRRSEKIFDGDLDGAVDALRMAIEVIKYLDVICKFLHSPGKPRRIAPCFAKRRPPIPVDYPRPGSLMEALGGPSSIGEDADTARMLSRI